MFRSPSSAPTGRLSRLRAALRRVGRDEARSELASLLATLDSHVWSGRIVDGRYVEDWCGPGLDQLLGGPVPEGVPPELAWLQAVHPDDRPLLRSTILNSFDGQIIEVDYRLIGVDGVTRWLRDRRRTVLRPDGVLQHQGITVDVSERKREADALREAESNLRAVAEALGAHPYAGRVEADGTYVETWTGPGLDRLLGGLPPAGVAPGATWNTCLHPDDAESVKAAEHAADADGHVVELEYRLVGLDGETRWIRDRARTERNGDGDLRRRGIAVDVTVERAASAHLDAVHERLEAIAHGSGEAFFELLQDADGVWRRVWSSARIDEILLGPGHHLDDAAALAHYHAATLDEDRPRWPEFVEELAAGRYGETAIRLRREDGELRWVWLRAWPLPSEPGTLRIAGISADVTERQRLLEDALASSRWLAGVLEGTGAHVYAAEIDAEGAYRDIFTGPGLDHFVGRSLPGDGFAVWRRLVVAEDREAWDAFVAEMAAGEDAELEYRMRGFDGEVRTVWERVASTRLDDQRCRLDGIVLDVTERRRVQAELERTREHLGAVLHTLDDMVFEGEVDHERGELRLLVLSPNTHDLIGHAGRTLDEVQRAYREAIVEEDLPLWSDAVAAMVRGESFDVEYRLRTVDGALRWLWTRGHCRLDGDGRTLAAGVTTDVTERHDAAEALARARDEADQRSRVDSLTGISSRWHFEVVLREALEEGERPAVIALDVDHFKRVNDAYGHRAGDVLLIGVAHRLAAVLPEGAVLARWGGEEFTVLLPGEPSPEAAYALAEAARVAIAAEPFEVQDGALVVTASAGVAVAADGSWTAEGLIDAADMAAYGAKRRGRDRTLRYEQLDASDLLDDEPEVVRLAEALARSAGAREQVPEVHAASVADLAVQVAERLGLPLPIVRRCRLGGWLHDVGKVAIPDRILMKPGALDADEWVTMRTHAPIGAQIVSRIPGLSDAALAVRHHHERWDGDGYPDRLAGEAIPVEARVVAAVDAWSAMTSDRVYRAALDAQAAAAELRRVAGQQLDPDVVEALLGVLGLARVAA